MFTLPIYSKAMGASAVEIGGLYSVFTITILLSRPAVGWAIDRFGRRRFLIAAMFAYALAMLCFSFSTSVTGLFLARLIQGIASALLWITVRTIVADSVAPAERGASMGRMDEATSRGGLIGIFLGFTVFKTISSFYSDALGWQITFVVYALLAAAGAMVAWRNLPETQPAVQSVHAPALQLPPQLMKLMAAVFLTNVGMALITPVYMIYLQDRFTTDMSILAWAFFPAGIVYSFLPSRLGRLSDRFGRAQAMAIGIALSGLLSMMIPVLTSLWLLGLLYTAESVGWSMAGPAEAAMVADLTGEEARGRGFGFYELAASLGASAGPLIGGWLYDAMNKAAPFYINGIILLLGAAWVIFVVRQKRPLESPTQPS